MTVRWSRFVAFVQESLLAQPWRIVAALTVVVLTAVTTGLAAGGERSRPGPARASATHPGLARLLAAAGGTAGDPVMGALDAVGSLAGRLAGVATLPGRGGPPSTAQVGALEALGLEVRPLEHLPLAFVAGTPAQLVEAVVTGRAADVYPNEQLRWLSSESAAAVGAGQLRAEGLTGEGIGVAIVDSGIDATHPDLADHVAANFKVVGGGYLNEPLSALIPPLVVPIDRGTTDLTTGHGTHVAGIVAADGSTTPDQVGVAPDARLIGYACGDLIFLFTQLIAFDHILEHRELYNIRVVNNSWGSSFAMFDPDDPINVATRALHDAGIVVVFAAGNAGDPGTLNPYAAAPWVISVAATTTDRKLAGFSSGGLPFDNTEVASVPANDHQRFEGDRLGIYHPDVAAPGQSIMSSGTPTGLGVLAPAPYGGTVSLSGTSMAAPHVAGLAALLLQARPDLTPDQVEQVLQATAAPVTGREGRPAEFWQTGYGFADGPAALALLRRPDFGPALLAQLRAERDARVIEQRSHRVLATDLWRYAAAPLSLGLQGEARRFEVAVPPDTVGFHVAVSYPTLPAVGANVFDYGVTLRDAAGRVVARSIAAPVSGLSVAFVDLMPSITGANVPSLRDLWEFDGRWTVEVRSPVAIADPETPLPGVMGNSVTVVVTSLGAKPVSRPLAETPNGPPPPEIAGIQLPTLPILDEILPPLAVPEPPVVDLPELPALPAGLGCPAGHAIRIDTRALAGKGTLLTCVPPEQ